MNRFIVAVAIAASTIAPVGAQEGKPAEPISAGQAEDTASEAPRIAVDCEARKFETNITFEKDGQTRETRLTICPAKGEDQEKWAKTLKDAKAKIEAHPNITTESKTRIGAELDAEILQAGSIRSATISLPEDPIPPASPPPEYGTYPPLPGPPALAVQPTQQGPAASTAKPTLAAMPPPKAVAKPRLSIQCLESGESGEGSDCLALTRGMRLAIKAGENLGSDTSLRFLRKGDIRGEIKLAGMRQGQLLRANLPQQLCTGVISSKVQIQVMRSNQVVETLGPYKLRC
ncbi:MAG TPA: hypothetical protein VFR36_07000 [Sphingomicrobium sp.]|nr:hypothetical protein [Sphingomicrobium sp.]